MNSGAPASMAPPDFSSLGMMVSQSEVSVSYWWGEKYLGVYFPEAAAAFSLCTAWWAYSAACAGMSCKTEPPAAVMASVFRMSRLLIPTVMLDIAFFRFVEEILGSAPGKSHDGQGGI